MYFLPIDGDGCTITDLTDVRRTSVAFLNANKDTKLMPVYTSRTMKR